MFGKALTFSLEWFDIQEKYPLAHAYLLRLLSVPSTGFYARADDSGIPRVPLNGRECDFQERALFDFFDGEDLVITTTYSQTLGKFGACIFDGQKPVIEFPAIHTNRVDAEDVAFMAAFAIVEAYLVDESWKTEEGKRINRTAGKR